MGNRCALCGGKLKNGICIDCGMDNRKSDTAYKSYEQDLAKTPSRQAKEAIERKAQPQKRQTVNATYVRTPINSSVSASSADKKKRVEGSFGVSGKTKSGGNGWKRKLFFGVAVPLIVFALLKYPKEAEKKKAVPPKVEVPAVEFDTDIVDSILSTKEAASSQETSMGEMLFRQLGEKGNTIDPSKGVKIERKLSPGQYIVGKDIPEGIYQAEAVSGSGIVFIDEGEGHSVMTEFLTSEAMAKELDRKSGEYRSRLLNLPLIDGASFYVETDLELLLKSDCGREDLIKERGANPLKEGFTIKEDRWIEEEENIAFYVAGQDFPVGVYDIVFREGNICIGCGTWILGKDDSDFPSHSFELSKESPVLHHVMMWEGAKIGLRNGGVIELVPSEYGE